MIRDPLAINPERWFLGCVMKSLDACRLLDTMQEDDFVDLAHRELFLVLRRLYAESKQIPDMVAVDDKAPHLVNTVLACYTEAVVTTNARTYAEIIKAATKRRRLVALSGEILSEAQNQEQDIDETIDAMRVKLQALSAGKPIQSDMHSIMQRTMFELYARMDGEIKPLSVGMNALDELTGGFLPGELVVIGARPSVGKSATLMDWATRFARRDATGIMHTLEMRDVQFGQRLITSMSGVSGLRMRRGAIGDGEYGKVTMAAAELSKLPVWIETRNRTVAQIKSATITVQEKHGLQYAMIDYLQLVKGPKSENRNVEVGAVSRAFKEMAQELGIVVFLAAQLNRDASNKRPTMANLRESGGIEQDADCVVLLHNPDREDVSGRFREAWDMCNRRGTAYMEIIVDKCRDGNVGIVPTEFNGAKMQFKSI